MNVVVTDEATLRRLVADEIKRALQPVLDAFAHQSANRGQGDTTLLTKAEVATLLRVDARTLRRMVHAGEVPSPICVGERTHRWRREAIERFLRAREGVALGGTRARL